MESMFALTVYHVKNNKDRLIPLAPSLAEVKNFGHQEMRASHVGYHSADF